MCNAIGEEDSVVSGELKMKEETTDNKEGKMIR